ncbi:MAG: leucine-rich repeat protein, partial [Dysgonamonadaceae bacterium]|nr:leucine-rich repeat protein [Dysgonamonadaceae bacterium]
MKKIILIAVFCAAVFSPARAYWSYKYWYCPVSWSEAKVYFQAYNAVDWEFRPLYVGGEGPLPDSNEDNTTILPFQYALGHLPVSKLPWGRNIHGNVDVDYGIDGISILGNDFRIVKVDEGITHIGNWWFSRLFMLREVSMPLSLQSIGEGAFEGCIRFPSFWCSNNVKSIGSRAFESCYALSEFYVYDPTGSYKISETPLNIGSRAFANCFNLKHLRISAGSTLGDEVFFGSGLESVDLGNNVKFGSNVFLNCKNFKQFTVSAGSTLGDFALANSSLETVTVNDNVTFGKHTFQSCENLKSVTFQGKINKITEFMFYNCSGLLSFNIPNGVTSIGDSAFYNCMNLSSVNIPNSVTSIGVRAFDLLYCLTSVTIPNSVTKIGESAFQQSGLTSITVPGSVKEIGKGVFLRCGNLTSARICEGVKTICRWAFQNCPKLETVSLPASLDSIGADVFGYCGGLKVIECNGTTPPVVNSYAFYGSDITGTSLCVPYGSVDAYRNAPVWKNFKNIGTYPAGIHIINGENFTVNSGSKIKLTAKLLPHDAVPAIVWTSSNSSIASVVDGTVTASAPGEAVITAT